MTTTGGKTRQKIYPTHKAAVDAYSAELIEKLRACEPRLRLEVGNSGGLICGPNCSNVRVTASKYRYRSDQWVLQRVTVRAELSGKSTITFPVSSTDEVNVGKIAQRLMAHVVASAERENMKHLTDAATLETHERIVATLGAAGIRCVVVERSVSTPRLEVWKASGRASIEARSAWALFNDEPVRVEALPAIIEAWAKFRLVVAQGGVVAPKEMK